MRLLAHWAGGISSPDFYSRVLVLREPPNVRRVFQHIFIFLSNIHVHFTSLQILIHVHVFLFVHLKILHSKAGKKKGFAQWTTTKRRTRGNGKEKIFSFFRFSFHFILETLSNTRNFIRKGRRKKIHEMCVTFYDVEEKFGRLHTQAWSSFFLCWLRARDEECGFPTS